MASSEGRRAASLSTRSPQCQPPPPLSPHLLTVLLVLLTGPAWAGRLIRVNANFPGAPCNAGAPCQLKSLGEALFEAQPGDRIVYECPQAARQGHPCEERGVVFRNKGDITLVAEPAHSLRFKGEAEPAAGSTNYASTLSFDPTAPGWTLEGVVVDGDRATAISRGLETFSEVVAIHADRTTLRNVVVENSGGHCVRIASTALGQQVVGVTIEKSLIRNCLDAAEPTEGWHPKGQARVQDANGIYSVCASRLVVRDNVIEQVSGDGVQLDYEQKDSEGIWEDVLITGNHISVKDEPLIGGLRPGEEGIDVKPGRGRVRIIGNTISGFRGFSPACDGKLLLGRGTGNGGSKGAGIVVHGRSTDCALGTPNLVNNYCAVIEGNDVSDTNIGIAVGASNFPNELPQGAPRGVFVLRNVIHDLSADAEQERDSDQHDCTASPPTPGPVDPPARGAGIRLSNAPLGVPLLEDIVIHHNTIANVPGVPLYEASGTSCGTCSYEYNLQSNFGPGCNFGAHGLTATLSNNICSPASNMGPECSTAVANVGFLEDSMKRPVAGSCGEELQGGNSTYDYSLSFNTPAGIINAASNSPHASTTGAVCGASKVPDVGAKEYCANDSEYGDGLKVWRSPNDNRIQVVASDYHRAATAFDTGVGAFRNVMRVTAPYWDGDPDRPLLANARCVGTGKDVDGCTFDTGSCSSFCTPTTAPNGERNCACVKNQERPFGALGAAVRDIETQLWVNPDLPGEDLRDDTTYMEYTRVTDYLAKLGWEDMHVDAARGDRDDYTAFISASLCSKNAAEDALNGGFEERSAPPACPTMGCGACDASTTDGTIKVLGFLSADHTDHAQPDEGRQLHATVTVFNYGDVGENLAVCPLIKWVETGDVLPLHYPGPDKCGGEIDLNSPEGALQFGQPTCVATPQSERMTVALARYQSFTSGRDSSYQCVASEGSDDADTIPGMSVCGGASVPGFKTFNFVVSLPAVDRARRDNNPEAVELSELFLENIEPKIGSFDVYVVRKLKSGRFYCPSGFDVRMGDVSADVGEVMVVRLSNTIYPRRTP